METWRMKERSEQKKKLLIIFVTGFVLGVFYIVLLRRSENSNMLMSNYFFSKYQYMDYSETELFWYVLKNRFSGLLFLWFMGITVFGSMAVLFYCLWIGFALGLILSMAVVRLGMAGMLLCIISMIPQYLVYIPAYSYGMVRVCERGQSKRNMGSNLITWLVMGSMILLGVILESYINPLLLKSFIKNF